VANTVDAIVDVANDDVANAQAASASATYRYRDAAKR
jgi:hypothetical protein